MADREMNTVLTILTVFLLTVFLLYTVTLCC